MDQLKHKIFSDNREEDILNGLRHSWIGGQLEKDAVGHITHLNPANGISLGDIDEAGSALVDRSIASCRHSFQAVWGKMQISERKKKLRDFANIVGKNVERLGSLETLEVGRPITEALGLLSKAPDLIFETVALMDRMQGDLAGADDRRMAVSWHRPRGVVAAITPWNFPTMNVLGRLIPALIAGNTVVLKPSEYAPRSAVLIAQLAIEAGIPEGVVNVIVGFGGVSGS